MGNRFPALRERRLAWLRSLGAPRSQVMNSGVIAALMGACQNVAASPSVVLVMSVAEGPGAVEPIAVAGTGVPPGAAAPPRSLTLPGGVVSGSGAFRLTMPACRPSPPLLILQRNIACGFTGSGRTATASTPAFRSLRSTVGLTSVPSTGLNSPARAGEVVSEKALRQPVTNVSVTGLYRTGPGTSHPAVAATGKVLTTAPVVLTRAPRTCGQPPPQSAQFSHTTIQRLVDEAR